MEDKEQLQAELCEISLLIIQKLEDANIELTLEQKEELHMSNNSMLFFIQQENWERAWKEGMETLNKLIEITES